MIYKKLFLFLSGVCLLALCACSSFDYPGAVCEGLRSNEENRNPAVSQPHTQKNCTEYQRVRDKELK